MRIATKRVKVGNTTPRSRVTASHKDRMFILEPEQYYTDVPEPLVRRLLQKGLVEEYTGPEKENEAALEKGKADQGPIGEKAVSPPENK